MHQKHSFQCWYSDVNFWRLQSHHGVSSIKEDSGCGVAWTVGHLNNRKLNFMKVMYVRYGGVFIEPYKTTRCVYLPLWGWEPQWNCPVKNWKTAFCNLVMIIVYSIIFLQIIYWWSSWSPVASFAVKTNAVRRLHKVFHSRTDRLVRNIVGGYLQILNIIKDYMQISNIIIDYLQISNIVKGYLQI